MKAKARGRKVVHFNGRGKQMTGEKLIEILTAEPAYLSITEEEFKLQEEQYAESGTSEREEAYSQALWNRERGGSVSVRRNELGEYEHPSAAVIRMGNESIRAGHPIEHYMLVLECMELVAETHDILGLILGCKKIRPTTIAKVRLEAKIADGYTESLTSYLAKQRKEKREIDFSDAKRQFKRNSPYPVRTIDRILVKHNLDHDAHSVASRVKK